MYILCIKIPLSSLGIFINFDDLIMGHIYIQPPSQSLFLSLRRRQVEGVINMLCTETVYAYRESLIADCFVFFGIFLLLLSP